MKTIVIAGSGSNIGKTRLAEKLLNRLVNFSALKVTTISRNSRCPHRKSNCGVCGNLQGEFQIIKDKRRIGQRGKDTARLKLAGANKVIWLKATLKGLKRGLKKAMEEFKDEEGIIIEGTSVLRYLSPDITIYLKDDTRVLKPFALKAEKKADIIIDASRYS